LVTKEKKENAATRDINVEKEQITTTNNDTEAYDQQDVVLNTVVISDSDGTKHRRKVKRKDDEVKNDSPFSFDQFELNLHERDKGDHKQEIIMMHDVGSIVIDPMTKNQRVVDTFIMEQIQPFTTIMNDINSNLDPIVEYAKEPLLPLAEACAPLINILHNLSVYVQKALDETPENPSDALTIDESAAIRLYTIEWPRPHRSLYSMLNHTLKKGDRKDLRPYFRYMKLFLTALVKLPCVPALTIWRGVTKDLSEEFPPGTPVTWWAFSSCTTELTVLENHMYLGDTGSRTLFSVEAINARTVRDHSHFVTEDEILLLPGTYMIVQSQFSPAPDLHIIHLKQVKPNEVLLEPPFEGHLNIFKLLV
jgi:hypothetical protein